MCVISCTKSPVSVLKCSHDWYGLHVYVQLEVLVLTAHCTAPERRRVATVTKSSFSIASSRERCLKSLVAVALWTDFMICA